MEMARGISISAVGSRNGRILRADGDFCTITVGDLSREVGLPG